MTHQEINIEPLDRWGFECPNCQYWNELEENPNYMDEVECDGCNKKFEPVING